MASSDSSTVDEIWKNVTVEPYCAHYAVSSLGRVRRETSFRHTHAGRILRLSMRHVYLSVELNHAGDARKFTVHTLVALAFHGPPPGPIGNQAGDWQVDHISGDKLDNRAVNVQWVTRLENMQLASHRGHMPSGDRNGRRKHPENYPKGETHYSAKLTAAEVTAIRALASQGMTHRALAEQFHTTHTNIGYILRGKTWRSLP